MPKAIGMFSEMTDDLDREEAAEDARLLQMAQMGSIAQDKYASLAGAKQAGQALGSMAVRYNGGDPRTSRERMEAAKKAISDMQQTVDFDDPASVDTYYQNAIRLLGKERLPSEAQAAWKDWQGYKDKQADLEIKRNQGNKDKLYAKWFGIQEKLLSEPDNIGLQAQADALAKILGIKETRVDDEWVLIGPTEWSPGYKYNKKTGAYEKLGPNDRLPGKPNKDNDTKFSLVTIADPKDPTKTLQVNGHVFNRERYMKGDMSGVVGEGQKLTEVGKANFTHQIKHAGAAQAIARARDILKGAKGADLPTESGAGAAIDYAGSLVGWSPKGAKEADQLRVSGGALVRLVPRFEGPQSDKDTAYYKEVAGRIGDATLPIARRLAALDEVERIWGEFEAGKKYGFFPGVQQPGQPPAVAPLGGPPPGAVRRKEPTKK